MRLPIQRWLPVPAAAAMVGTAVAGPASKPAPECDLDQRRHDALRREDAYLRERLDESTRRSARFQTALAEREPSAFPARWSGRVRAPPERLGGGTRPPGR